MIQDLFTEFDRKGIELRLANISRQARDVLRRAGIEETAGKLDRTTTIAALVEQSRNSHAE
jgi:hypothetical protein